MKSNIGYVIVAIGFLLMLGTAGASDIDLISFGQIVIQSIIGLCLMAMGLLLVKLFFAEEDARTMGAKR